MDVSWFIGVLIEWDGQGPEYSGEMQVIRDRSGAGFNNNYHKPDYLKVASSLGRSSPSDTTATVLYSKKLSSIALVRKAVARCLMLAVRIVHPESPLNNDNAKKVVETFEGSRAVSMPQLCKDSTMFFTLGRSRTSSHKPKMESLDSSQCVHL
ncbi:hypothetical protein VNO77_23141 [Canavalia gladiata]|uniref:Uncharacterized protein n=1 Tax=Canavalia gladiata TaxID=3824 RepID=A0AAN9QBG5_CANGL